MPVAFLDTNIILRYLTRDDAAKADRCLDLLRRAASGKIELVTSDLVIGEVAWNLLAPTNYGLSKRDVRDKLLPLLTLPGLHVPSRDAFVEALDLFIETNIDFTDAFNAATMAQHGITDIYSYDRDFDRLGDVRRIEP